MKDWKTLKKEILKDPEVRREYERLEPEYQIIRSIIRARLEKGLTQAQLAKKARTKQSAISRFEQGNTNPTLSFLQKVAEALDSKLVIRLR